MHDDSGFDPAQDHTFGSWAYSAVNQTLTVAEHEYTIELLLIQNPAQLLDVMFDIYEETWGRAAITDLIEAFRWIFDPHLHAVQFQPVTANPNSISGLIRHDPPGTVLTDWEPETE
jgi:hypothetical protein